MKKIIVISLILFLFTGCNFGTKRIVVKEYKSKKIFIPSSLTEQEIKIQVPVISNELNINDQIKIKEYILNLYFRSKTYESRLKTVDELITNFNTSIKEEKAKSDKDVESR